MGFIINPIAGMGGAVGLKGTDGDAYVEALELGAQPVTPRRARDFISKIKYVDQIFVVVAPTIMGENILNETEISYKVVGALDVGVTTTSTDTKRIVKKMLEEEIDILVFVGGDGTSRDVYDVVNSHIPVLGIPSGVKMFSSVFAVNPDAAAEIVDAFIKGDVEIVEKEVLDINEDAFRKSKLDVSLYGYMRVPSVRNLIQASKAPSRAKESQKENQEAIARYIIEEMSTDILYLLGPGTTTRQVTDELQVDKTLLGVDAVYNKEVVGKDLNEEDILTLLKSYKDAKIIVSPIGGQGFIFGRGNQEFSPDVIRCIGKDNVIVIATKDKISDLKSLRVDTGSFEIDEMLKGYHKVLTDYREWRMIKINS
jgi:predicted polyphosphate/ATP-dependent NAD kinase